LFALTLLFRAARGQLRGGGARTGPRSRPSDWRAGSEAAKGQAVLSCMFVCTNIGNTHVGRPLDNTNRVVSLTLLFRDARGQFRGCGLSIGVEAAKLPKWQAALSSVLEKFSVKSSGPYRLGGHSHNLT